MSVPSYADTGAFTINFWMRRFGSFDGTTSGIGVQYLFSHVSADIATDFTGDGGQQNITRPNQVCPMLCCFTVVSVCPRTAYP